LGIKTHQVTICELHRYITETIRAGLYKTILHTNAYCLNLAFENSWLRQYINSADLVFCDGAGVLIGAKLLGCQLPGRITYADWFWQLANLAENNHFSMFLLGSKPGVAEKAAANLIKKHPCLKIVGMHHGYFDKSLESSENESILAMINSLQPNILIVGFGMPIQEKWLMENRWRINANIALTGGAAFDYVSGDLQRAPRWMTDHHFEWLGRLIIEPKRLWRRYIIGNPVFIFRVLMQRIGLLRV
jgi:N-acetylglucosaminyldiphosphoundecaprenol N-acetyl-beta-D-mannosaminyltransferase